LFTGYFEQLIGEIDVGEGPLDAKYRGRVVDAGERGLDARFDFLAAVRRQTLAGIGDRAGRTGGTGSEIAGLQAARVSDIGSHAGDRLEHEAPRGAHAAVGIFRKRL